MPSSSLEITSYAHCAECVAEYRRGARRGHGQSQAMAEFARLSVGLTNSGLQVWCAIHGINVLNLDFGKAKPSANSSADMKNREPLIEDGPDSMAYRVTEEVADD